jgi:hypothetical protein
MEARGVVKFLGEGAGKVQALRGVDPDAAQRRVGAADGPIRQRQDHAAFGARLHLVAERGRRPGLRQADDRWGRRRIERHSAAAGAVHPLWP